MIIKIKNWKKAILNKEKTIKHAIKCLNDSAFQIILVEYKKKFFGTITDGDIRRGLVSGCKLSDKIEKIVNRNSVIAEDSMTLISVENLMEINLINSLPIVDNKKKICGLYLSNFKEMSVEKPVVIFMAGGRGTRLMPLTKKTPKGMIKINGIPMMEIILKKFINEGFSNFIFSVNYLSKKIINYFKDGSKWGVKIKYFEEKNYLGTIGSVYYLKKFIKDNFILINCDVITKVQFLDMYKYHLKNESIGTIGTRVVETKSQFGHLKTNGFEILEILEKPVEKKFINAGIYIFNREVLKLLKKNKKTDIPDLLTKLLNEKKRLIIFPIYEKWDDLGRHKDLKKYKR